MSTRQAQLYINGQWRDASDGGRFDDINPFNQELVGTAADATASDVDAAITAARNAFDSTDWSTNLELRERCIRQIEEGMRKAASDLGTMGTTEAGIPSSMANLIDSIVEEVSYAAEVMDSFDWEKDLPVYDMMGMRSARRVRHEARGVVGAITPWNAPTPMNVGKAIPAMATGNTVVLKPAQDTPLSAVILAEIIDKTDVPAGVFNLITSNNTAIGGDLLTGDPRVNMFHFTGSTAVGQRIASRAAEGFRKVVLELGGKSANIILDDADLDSAIPYGVGMCFLNSGQGCLLPTRLLVHESKYKEVLDRCVAVAEAMPWGDPNDPAIQVGPIIRKGQLDRMAKLVDNARSYGATIATGGTTGHPDYDKGFWYRPTVVTNVEPDSEIAQTEVFGPVLTVLKYSGSDDDAVRIANGTKYGLGGFVQTSDPERGWRIANAMRAGGVAIGNSFWVAADTPFGGYGQSGLGRERGIEGFLEFLQTKAISSPAGV